MTKVKICGITNLEDALTACKAGADALGFVFYPKSPRYISPNEALKISSKIPPFVKKTALFVNETAQKVNSIMKYCKMDLAQIHFEAKESFYTELDFEYIKVIRAKQKEDLQKIDKNEFYIVDAFVESYGGEGKRVALQWFKGIDCSNLILAGGLTPENVKEVTGCGFYGLDVSSGVELKKGKKDSKKVYDFIKAVKDI
ncbi:MAG: phosphoribosylanthranilate isomerase [Epsilonproteobacteria bacterium]|nr:phosphoribosylanthranilate isomerase [Campylobacterota bacterium]